MTSIAELSEMLQALLTTTANEVARKSGFIQRERQVTGAGFAQALVLGGLAQPGATRKQVHQQARQAGIAISVQGLDQRFEEASVRFMRGLLEAGLSAVVNSEEQAVVLPPFQGVYLTDCTRLVWGEVGVKMGVRLELQRGQVQACLTALKQHDQKAPVVDSPMPAGALHLGDLGFFKLQRFRQWNTEGVYWLTRYKVGTHLSTPEGQPLDLKTLLTGSEPLHMAVIVGKGQHALTNVPFPNGNATSPPGRST